MEKEPVEKKKRPGADNIKGYPRNTEEARARGRKGGKASGEARRRKRDLRLAIEALFEEEYTDKMGNTLSGAEVIALKQMEKAMKGDWRAFQLLRDTAGQKPVEKVMVSEVDQKTIDDVEKAIFEEDD